jgi:hypothetical protein
MIGGTTPRRNAAPTGNSRAQLRQSPVPLVREIVIRKTPDIAVMSPASCSGCSGSWSTITASVTENSGARLPSAPVTTGPSSRLDEKVRVVSKAGKTRPTPMKIGTARQTTGSPRSRIGDNSRKTDVKAGTLTAAPDNGGRYFKPNCVMTTPVPNRIAAANARPTAIVSGDKGTQISRSAATSRRLTTLAAAARATTPQRQSPRRRRG